MCPGALCLLPTCQHDLGSASGVLHEQQEAGRRWQTRQAGVTSTRTCHGPTPVTKCSQCALVGQLSWTDAAGRQQLHNSWL